MHRKSKEAGVILAMSLLIMLVLLLLGATILQMTVGLKQRTERSYKAIYAVNLAEAGVEKAIWTMNYDDISTWNGDESLRQTSFSLADGSVQVKVFNPDGERPVVSSVGSVRFTSFSVSKGVRVVLEPEKSPLYRFGVFAGERVVLASKVVVEANVGTNGTSTLPGEGAVVLNEGSRVKGNAVCGEGGNPQAAIQLSQDAAVDGETKSLNEEVKMPSVVVPELSYSSEDIVVKGSLEFDASFSGQYTSLSITRDSTLTIVGDVTLVVSDLSIGKEATLRIAEGGSLRIYVDRSIQIDNTCYINNDSKDATKLLFYGTDNLTGEIEFACRSDFYGAIYLPRVSLSLARDFDSFGAIYAGEILLNNDVHAAYDEGLSDIAWLPTDPQERPKYVVRSWQESRAF